MTERYKSYAVFVSSFTFSLKITILLPRTCYRVSVATPPPQPSSPLIPLSPNINIPILQTDLHTFLKDLIERI